MRTFLMAAFAALVAISAPSLAHAERLTYTANLSGAQAPTITGSGAIGTATFVVDTEAHTVDLDMRVTGLALSNLNQHIIHLGLGPVHLHLYHPNGDVSLLVPFPYGDTYAATPDGGGFTIRVRNYSYAEGATLLHSDMSFDAFLASLQSDFVYLNVHTTAFGDGEISGRLQRAS